jgi:hypothetical protein
LDEDGELIGINNEDEGDLVLRRCRRLAAWMVRVTGFAGEEWRPRVGDVVEDIARKEGEVKFDVLLMRWEKRRGAKEKVRSSRGEERK